MSTATRKQLESRVETLGVIVDKLISEMGNLKDLAIGTMTLVKELPGYEEALQKMKDDLKENKEEN
jgi:hypothetical protein